MAGSSLFSIVIKTLPVEEIPQYVFALSAAALGVPIVTSNYTLIMLGFLVFEGCVGMYFPAMGTLKVS